MFLSAIQRNKVRQGHSEREKTTELTRLTIAVAAAPPAVPPSSAVELAVDAPAATLAGTAKVKGVEPVRGP